NKAERIVSVGSIDWKFAVRCLIRHSKGQFTYEATSLFIHADCFAAFGEQLGRMGNGKSQEAKLADLGEMFSFALRLSGRRLRSELKIREYKPGDELKQLSAGFEVEYDLFVNKLRDDVAEFNAALRSVIPEDI